MKRSKGDFVVSRQSIGTMVKAGRASGPYCGQSIEKMVKVGKEQAGVASYNRPHILGLTV